MKTIVKLLNENRIDELAEYVNSKYSDFRTGEYIDAPKTKLKAIMDYFNSGYEQALNKKLIHKAKLENGKQTITNGYSCIIFNQNINDIPEMDITECMGTFNATDIVNTNMISEYDYEPYVFKKSILKGKNEKIFIKLKNGLQYVLTKKLMTKIFGVMGSEIKIWFPESSLLPSYFKNDFGYGIVLPINHKDYIAKFDIEL